MLLYQPTEAEIAAAFGKAVSNYPELVTRMVSAVAILRDVKANLAYSATAGAWQVRSQSDPELVYHLYRGRECDCPDYRYGQPGDGQLCNGERVCKHTLAVRMYRHILTMRLARAAKSLLVNQAGHSMGRLEYRVGWGYDEFVKVWRKGDAVSGQAWGPYQWRDDFEMAKFGEFVAKAAGVAVAMARRQLELVAA